MQNNKNNSIEGVFNLLNQVVKNENISVFEKHLCKLMDHSSFMPSSSFPKMDSYAIYKDESQKEIDKIQFYIYLAGYRKDDIDIELNDAQKTLTIKGQIKDKKYFPENNSNITRLTNNVSAKKFRVNLNIPNHSVGDVSMEDGVLMIDIIPVEDKSTTKININ